MSGVTETTGAGTPMPGFDDWLNRVPSHIQTVVRSFADRLSKKVSQNQSPTYVNKYNQGADQYERYNFHRTCQLCDRIQSLTTEWQNANSATVTLSERTVNMLTEVELENQQLDAIHAVVKDALAYLSPPDEQQCVEAVEHMSKHGYDPLLAISKLAQLHTMHLMVKGADEKIQDFQNRLLTARNALLTARNALKGPPETVQSANRD
ncbi:MAG: hypothetical protein KGR16_05995 [Verrucomicrobia bacterium]|nr:hypothetical protein [Verrucomicrobiota bacterium]MDE3047008.1 hypothetical protein [Verrucomicrobiota bacterium]